MSRKWIRYIIYEANEDNTHYELIMYNFFSRRLPKILLTTFHNAPQKTTWEITKAFDLWIIAKKAQNYQSNKNMCSREEQKM